MKILQINTVFPQGSTGKICRGISEVCRNKGNQSYIAYSYKKSRQSVGDFEIKINSWLDHHIHNRIARITMWIGCFSYFATKRFLNRVEKINPDVIHLHNIHGNFINLRLLFKFIKSKDIPIVWTLHDCWSYTGYCAYYDAIGCDKWKHECNNCPNRHSDSVTKLDCSNLMHRKKKKMFLGVKKMMIVTPSEWLKNEVRESFLGDYPISVINNGIDLKLFSPKKSNFREKYNIDDDQFIILGVANIWEKRKGLDDFLELAERLDKRYKIVLVGTTSEIDQRLPQTIVSIHRTQNAQELAEIYSAADLFVIPTVEDNFPTVNIESLACGTPVLTYNTGGSPEIIDDSCGSVVPCGDIDALEREIKRICNEKPYKRESCVERAQKYDMRNKFQEYVKLYEEFLNDRLAED